MMAEPLFEKEIFVHRRPSSEIHIIVSIYRHSVFVSQYDTTDVIWGILGEYLHAIRVEAPRQVIERYLCVHGDEDLANAIADRFGGPNAVDRWLSFCREKGFSRTIHEDGLDQKQRSMLSC